MRRSDRAQARLAQGPAAVLSVSEASALLPLADGRARHWLKRHDLIRDLDGKPVVLWGDVLAILGRDDGAGGVGSGRDGAPVPSFNVPRTPLKPFTRP